MGLTGGFSCSKNTLIFLNICYVLVALILIGVGTSYGTSTIASLPKVSGLVACGVGLLLVAVLGLVGTVKHHQVLLFFYMSILFLIFLIQFSVAIACLTVTEETEKTILEAAWSKLSSDEALNVEKKLSCCGFESFSGRNCSLIPDCGLGPQYDCPTCFAVVQPKMDQTFRTVGVVGLLFSFVELLGAMLACRYRNMMNPDKFLHQSIPRPGSIYPGHT